MAATFRRPDIAARIGDIAAELEAAEAARYIRLADTVIGAADRAASSDREPPAGPTDTALMSAVDVAEAVKP